MLTLVAILSFSFLGTVVTTAVFIGLGRLLQPKHRNGKGEAPVSAGLLIENPGAAQDGPGSLQVPETATTLRRALEKAGVKFIAENGRGPGVRLAKR